MDIYQDALNGIKNFVSKNKCCDPDEMLLFKILQELIDSQNDNKRKLMNWKMMSITIEENSLKNKIH